MNSPDRVQRELLTAYRSDERMPPDARAAAWSRLQAAIHADALHEELAASERRTSGRRLHWGVVALAAAAIAVLVAGLRDRADRAHTERDHQAAHDAAHARPQAPQQRRAEPPTSPQLAPPAAPPTPGLPRPPARVDDLDAELALLRGARTALAAGAGDEALTLLAEHARRFPAGDLAEERMVLRVQALCAVGRRDEARAAAASFAGQRLGSPHRSTIAASCPDP